MFALNCELNVTYGRLYASAPFGSQNDDDRRDMFNAKSNFLVRAENGKTNSNSTNSSRPPNAKHVSSRVCALAILERTNTNGDANVCVCVCVFCLLSSMGELIVCKCDYVRVNLSPFNRRGFR